MVSGTGLGNPEKAVLDNVGMVNSDFADAAIETYFQRWEGFDFSVNKNYIAVGIEPSYQYDKLKILYIHKNKEKSYIKTGIAFGGYGSQVVASQKFYKDYKNSCKFVKFVDKWHNVLFGESNEG